MIKAGREGEHSAKQATEPSPTDGARNTKPPSCIHVCPYAHGLSECWRAGKSCEIERGRFSCVLCAHAAHNKGFRCLARLAPSVCPSCSPSPPRAPREPWPRAGRATERHQNPYRASRLHRVHGHPALVRVFRVSLSVVEDVGRAPRVRGVDRKPAGQRRVLNRAARFLDVFNVRKAGRVKCEDGHEADVLVHAGQRDARVRTRDAEVVRELRGRDPARR